MEEEKNNQQEAPKQEGPKNTKGALAQFEAFLEEYLVKKAPFALPMGAKEFIVKAAPYLVIILALLALPAIFAAVGLSALFAPMSAMYGYAGFAWGYGAIISLAASVAALALELIAVPGLFKRTKKSWRLVFYASIISLAGSILSFHGIIGGIIGAIIGWYILFQVREMYKN